MLAEVASLATADVAGDIHLCARFCEWEVARAQADLGICTEHLASEGEEHLLEVGEAYVLIYIETFYLVEEAVSTCADSLVAIYSSWAQYADRWLVGLHIVSLVVRGMATEKYILGNIVGVGLLDEECILHVAGWMIGSEVQHGEYVLVVIYLWTLIESESHAAEDVDDLILHHGQWMAGSERYRKSCTGQVDVIA